LATRETPQFTRNNPFFASLPNRARAIHHGLRSLASADRRASGRDWQARFASVLCAIAIQPGNRPGRKNGRRRSWGDFGRAFSYEETSLARRDFPGMSPAITAVMLQKCKNRIRRQRYSPQSFENTGI
jgi:hypothetical protein